MRMTLIFLAGGAGALARYLMSGWVLRLTGPSFPAGTLAVNATGSLLIGLVMHVALTTEAVPPDLRIALTIGLLGGFTTYSTFNYETLQLAQRGAWGLATANMVATLVLCLVAGIAGLALGRLVTG